MKIDTRHKYTNGISIQEIILSIYLLIQSDNGEKCGAITQNASSAGRF